VGRAITLNYAALPDDPVERRRTLEKRAEPSPTRPPVSPRLEADLAEVEEKSAQCYLSAEENTYRFKRAADRILNWAPRYGLRAPTGDPSG
jgi:hypothetical protein